MGLFKLDSIQKAAGIKINDSISERGRRMSSYLKTLQQTRALTKEEQKYLQKSDNLEKRQQRADKLTNSITVGEKPHCPQCGSTNVQPFGQQKKAFSVGKAVAGGLLTGGIGTLAGFAGKKDGTAWVCLDCGNSFAVK